MLTAPFEAQDLLRRVRKLLAGRPGMVVRVGELAVDLAARRVTVDGKRIGLTRGEYELLAYLARCQGRAVSYEELLKEVWGQPSGEGDPRLVIRCVTRLRKKLGEDARHPEYVVNVRGVGYRLRGQRQWEEAVAGGR